MNGKSTAYGIVLAQFAAAIVLAAVAGGIWGPGAGYSALVGGLISAVSSLYFALHVFGVRASAARAALRSFYTAEVVKMAITVLLFVAAVVWLKVDFLPLIVAYALTLLVYWFALLLSAPPVTKANQA
jgi:ATP synthase protein I